MPDPHKNFAVGTVLTAPSPATSGTSLVLGSGQGALFPQPSTDGAFNVVIYPSGAQPTAANAEIARCTARSTDTLTIARTQEGSSARTVVVGDVVSLAVTAKTLTDAETFVNASTLGISPANSASVNKAAFDAAMTFLGSTGGTLFCDWTGTVNIDISSTPITPTGNVTVVGRGRETKIKCANPGAVDVEAFYWSSGSNITFTLKDLTLEGPTTLSGAHIAAGVQNDTTSGLIRIINCSIRLFTYCLRRSVGSISNSSLDVLDSDLEGYGSGSSATCILWNTVNPGGSTGFLRVRGGSITNWGDAAATNLFHAMYFPKDQKALIQGVRFGGNAVTGDSGPCIQILDGSPFDTTNANATSGVVIADCIFEDGSANSGGIIVGALGNHHTKITSCAFLNRGYAIQADGPCSIANCSFFGTTLAGTYAVWLSTAGAQVTLTACKFQHAGLSSIGMDATGCTLDVCGCEFVQNTAQSHVIGISSASDNTSSVRVRNCRFIGVNNNETILLDSGCPLLLESCQFASSGANALIYNHTNGTGKTLRAHYNDFSQAGATIFNDSTVIAKMRVSNNYGSVGLNVVGFGTCPGNANMFKATDYNLIAQSFDPLLAQGGSILAAGGTVNFVRLMLDQPATIANVLLFVTVAGATLTAGQSFAALYQGGSLKGTTSSQSATWNSTGLKTMALASGPFSVTEGEIVVAFFSVGTTLPTFLRAAVIAGLGAALNLGLATPNMRVGTADTGRTTTFPASMGAQTAGTIGWWAGVS